MHVKKKLENAKKEQIFFENKIKRLPIQVLRSSHLQGAKKKLSIQCKLISTDLMIFYHNHPETKTFSKLKTMVRALGDLPGSIWDQIEIC